MRITYTPDCNTIECQHCGKTVQKRSKKSSKIFWDIREENDTEKNWNEWRNKRD